jgi:TetR/AcrR family transcriptional regulator
MAERDGNRTREAILDAAESLFARHGFDGTSIQQICDAASVARSTPAYFFGSKEALYEAVLARVVSRAQEAMARAYQEGDGGRAPADAVESYVGAFLDFLVREQTFVRLIQREALGDGSRVTEFFGRPVEDAIAALTPTAQQAGISPQRLVLDLAALCWYPFAHEHTLLPALGMNPRDPSFLEAQKKHLSALVRALVESREREGDHAGTSSA